MTNVPATKSKNQLVLKRFMMKGLTAFHEFCFLLSLVNITIDWKLAVYILL